MNYLIKIGGSLGPQRALAISKALKRYCRTASQKVFLFPGGGQFANLIRKYRSTFSLSHATTHDMALACLDQNAFLLADVCKCSVITDIKDIKRIKEFPVIIAPYRILTQKRPFSGFSLNIDTLTSSSSALYFANRLKAKVVIATNVDGVFDKDPRSVKTKAQLKRRIDSTMLKRISNGGPLDETLATLIDAYAINTWVVNGRYPKRILQILMGKNPTKGTLITPRSTR